MTWPATGTISNAQLDNGGDNPSVARVAVNVIAIEVEQIKGARGTANGIAPVDVNSKVPPANLPIGGASGLVQLTAGGLLPTSVMPRNPVKPEVWTQIVPGTYTFTVPAGVFWLYVEAWGGGGGGGWANGSTHAGGGGASGGAIRYWAVSPGDTLNVVIGAGGAGGVGGADNDGGDGGDTTVTHNITGDSMVAQRGFGGHAVSTNAGGDGGYASGVYDVRFYGGVGGTGILTGNVGVGMGGIGGSNGRGGSSPAGSGVGDVGFGGGGYGSGLGGPTPAKPGHTGAVIIVY